MKNSISIFFFSILFLVLSSCKKEKIENLKVSHNLNFDSIVGLPYDEALSVLGKPIEGEATFFNIKKDGLGGARIGLNTIYKGFPDVTILEASWKKDSVNDILIWYAKKDGKWEPIESFIYEHGAEF